MSQTRASMCFPNRYKVNTESPRAIYVISITTKERIGFRVCQFQACNEILNHIQIIIIIIIIILLYAKMNCYILE